MKKHWTRSGIMNAAGFALLISAAAVSVVVYLLRYDQLWLWYKVYQEKLLEAGLEVLIREQAGITEVNRIIYDELCLGDIKDSSKQTYLTIIDDLKNAGAKAVILGCTEIGLLVKQADTALPLYDTTTIHAQKAAELAING